MTLLALIPVIVLICCGTWRAALCVLGAALLLDLVIALLRVGARATLEKGVFSLKILAGPVKMKIMPRDVEKPQKPKAEKPPKEKKEKAEKKEKEKKKLPFQIDLELISTVLSAVGNLLGRLRRKICIDRLTLHYTVAAEDPFSAAMTYGYASAGVSALMPVIENLFKVKESDVGAAVTFDSSESDLYLDAQLTLAVWEILYIALAVWPVVRNIVRQFMNKRKVDKNGKSSDQ